MWVTIFPSVVILPETFSLIVIRYSLYICTDLSPKFLKEKGRDITAIYHSCSELGLKSGLGILVPLLTSSVTLDNLFEVFESDFPHQLNGKELRTTPIDLLKDEIK